MCVCAHIHVLFWDAQCCHRGEHNSFELIMWLRWAGCGAVISRVSDGSNERVFLQSPLKPGGIRG